MSLFKEINEGNVYFTKSDININDLDWNAHPSFEGVYLKHLVKGDKTDNKFSCHIVKIKAGFQIGEHIHKDNWELHEPIEGVGKGFVEGKEIIYKLGVSAVIPEGVKHSIVAGDNDLYLLAKFVPALV